MRDWLAQLLPHSVVLQGALQPLADEGGAVQDVSGAVLWETLLKGLGAVSRAYCVIDALDEMDTDAQDAADFLRRLNGLATFRPARVKLLITSRPRPDLQSGLSAASTLLVSLQEDAVAREIETFIAHRLDGSQVQADSQANKAGLPTLLVAKDVATRSRGLFLYARLLLDQMETNNNGQLSLAALPLGLEDMYQRMLAQQVRQTGASTEAQTALLGCVTHCARPLRLRELAGFLDQRLGMGLLDRAKRLARTACHPLVQLLDDETVQVMHHSVAEFLVDTTLATSDTRSQFPVLHVPDVHRNLAVACRRGDASAVADQGRGRSAGDLSSVLGIRQAVLGLPHIPHRPGGGG